MFVMPVYYFAYEGQPLPEDSGVELKDDAAALAHAEIIAGELGHHSSRRPKIVVFNEKRERI